MAIAAGPLLIITAFSWLFLFDGSFRYRKVYQYTSPNTDHTLIISKRVAFPATEMVDPAIIVKLELSGHTPACRKIRLEEDSDLIIPPSIIWNSSGVVITNLSTRIPVEIEFILENQ